MLSFAVPTSTPALPSEHRCRTLCKDPSLKKSYKHLQKYGLLENAHSPKLRKTGWKIAPFFETIISWADLMLQQDSDMR